MEPEPFADIGAELVRLINAGAGVTPSGGPSTMPAFATFDFADVLTHFSYSYTTTERMMQDNAAVVLISPFSESDSFEQDDCFHGWDVGLQIVIHSQVEKGIESSIDEDGSATRTRDLMALRNWIKRTLNSDLDIEFAANGVSYVRREVQPNEVMERDAADVGDFQSTIVVIYRESESRVFNA